VKDHLLFLLFTKSTTSPKTPKSAVPGHCPLPPCQGPGTNTPLFHFITIEGFLFRAYYMPVYTVCLPFVEQIYTD